MEERPFEDLHTLFDYSDADKDWFIVRDFIEDMYDHGNGMEWDKLTLIMQAARRLARGAGSDIA